MQPTPATRTEPSSPPSRTAPCKRSSTAPAPEETHPAATQQRTCVAGRDRRSSSAIPSRSDSSIRHPSFHLAQQALGGQVALDGPVEDDRRGDAARAQAAGGEQGQSVVGGGL